MKQHSITTAHLSGLIEWYRIHRRDLPWRQLQGDPYAVWVSEIMLQQTQAATVIPFFERWMARFPTLQSVASASLDEVLSLWAGLGYYARARNLHRAAQLVVNKFEGRVPHEMSALLRLPGVGRYTAGAIRSIAFNLATPVLDANVTRVLSRVSGIEGNPKTARNQRELWSLAEDVVHRAPERPGFGPRELNQALMELGALVCTPSDPACDRCPLLPACHAGNSADPTAWPQTAPGTRTVRVTHACIALVRDGRILMVQRPPHGLWGGLWELPRRACETGESPRACAERAAREVVGVDAHAGEAFGSIAHSVTHHAIRLHGFRASEWSGEPTAVDCAAVRWTAPESAGSLPIASPQKQILGLIAEFAGGGLKSACGGGVLPDAPRPHRHSDDSRHL